MVRHGAHAGARPDPIAHCQMTLQYQAPRGRHWPRYEMTRLPSRAQRNWSVVRLGVLTKPVPDNLLQRRCCLAVTCRGCSKTRCSMWRLGFRYWCRALHLECWSLAGQGAPGSPHVGGGLGVPWDVRYWRPPVARQWAFGRRSARWSRAVLFQSGAPVRRTVRLARPRWFPSAPAQGYRSVSLAG